MYDYIVVGRGMIGTAATRYLSGSGKKTAVIGPKEPEDWQNHQGVFASHYDESRITRILDEASLWATLAKRSMEEYPVIEQKSGLVFHHPVGGLQVGPTPEKPSDYIAKLQTVSDELKINSQKYRRDQLQQKFPFFTFPEGFTGIHEEGFAGYINPRQLVAAQLQLAQQNGAEWLDQSVTSLQKKKDFVELTTHTGQSYQAQKVLIAAGGYTNFLLERPLDLSPKACTLVFAEVLERDLAFYEKMTTLIYEFEGHSLLTDIYMMPVVQYPNGKYYLKIGGGHFTSGEQSSTATFFHTFEELTRWFQSEGDQAEADALKQILFSTVPHLKKNSVHTKPCVTTYTSHGNPYIDTLENNQIYVATGGCGASAKSSNEIGKIAAQLVQNEGWASDLPENSFKAIFKD